MTWVWPELKGQTAQAKKHKEFRSARRPATPPASRSTATGTTTCRWAGWRTCTCSSSGATAARARCATCSRAAATSSAAPTRTPTDFDISPDGRRLVFAFDPAPASGSTAASRWPRWRSAAARSHVIARDAEWDFGAPRYSPDGDRIAFIASHQAIKHTMPAQLAVWEREAGNWELVSGEWDHEVHAPLLWEADGQAVLFTAEAKGPHPPVALRPARPPRRSGRLRRLGQRLRQGRRHAGDAGRLGAAPGAAARAPAGARRRCASRRFNDELLAPVELGRVEETLDQGRQRRGAHDGRRRPDVARLSARLRREEEVPAAAQHPRRPAHRPPATTGITAGTRQVFAAQGYVVASVNYHGSSSFGYAFLDSITHRWGELELQDIEAGTDWLLKKPWIDRQRVFATGGSYGGYMVAWMNGHCRRTLPGLHLPRRLLRLGRHVRRRRLDLARARSWAPGTGTTWPRSRRRARTPSPRAMNTPTLVIHGALDYRVPDAPGPGLLQHAQGTRRRRPAALVSRTRTTGSSSRATAGSGTHEFFGWLSAPRPRRAQARLSRQAAGQP